jgi:outer membrane murein-binding lipoprotein Lpp
VRPGAIGFVVSTLVVGALAPTPITAATAAIELPAGDFNDVAEGRPHELRFRPVLADVKPMKKKAKRAAVRRAEAAVAACDAVAIPRLRTVPTTHRRDDDPSACVVVAQRDAPDVRYLLGPSRLNGSAVDSSRPHRTTRRRAKGTASYAIDIRFTDTGLAAFNTFAGEQLHHQIAVVLDSRVLSSPTMQPDEDTFVPYETTFEVVPSGHKTNKETTAQLAGLINRTKLEELSDFATQTSMTASARRIFAGARPQVDARNVFADDCPSPESSKTFVLGCYRRGRIYLSRVERADLAPVMPVTAAHEMLHAAYEGLSRRERRSIDQQLDEFFRTSADARLRELVADYDRSEPGERQNELHSLVPTEVAELPSGLEKYFRRYFRDRSRVVAAFESYQHVFDELEQRADQLDREIRALEAQLDGLEPQVRAAEDEANRLAQQIDSLRAQGRIDESNNLVGAQNAAVDRGRALIDQFNSAVDVHNAKIKELDFIEIVVSALYDSLQPIE